MKRITILTATFLCLFGLMESPAQNTQSSRNMEKLKLTGMGQDVPEERQGEPQQSDLR